jgi:hypothetical protein
LAAAVEPRGEGRFEASHRTGDTTVRGRERIAAATAPRAGARFAARSASGARASCGAARAGIGL